jgi:hypothetical protein
MAYAADLRLSTRIDHGFHEWLVRTRLETPDRVMDAVKWRPMEESPSVLRDHYKRRFELLIWLLLLKDQFDKTGEGFTEQSEKSFEALLTRLSYHVPGGLLRYWLSRFVDPETGRPFTDVVPPPCSPLLRMSVLGNCPPT